MFGFCRADWYTKSPSPVPISTTIPSAVSGNKLFEIFSVELSVGTTTNRFDHDEQSPFCVDYNKARCGMEESTSLCNLSELCVSVVEYVAHFHPQRHREHRGCTEKQAPVLTRKIRVRAQYLVRLIAGCSLPRFWLLFEPTQQFLRRM